MIDFFVFLIAAGIIAWAFHSSRLDFEIRRLKADLAERRRAASLLRDEALDVIAILVEHEDSAASYDAFRLQFRRLLSQREPSGFAWPSPVEAKQHAAAKRAEFEEKFEQMAKEFREIAGAK